MCQLAYQTLSNPKRLSNIQFVLSSLPWLKHLFTYTKYIPCMLFLPLFSQNNYFFRSPHPFVCSIGHDTIIFYLNQPRTTTYNPQAHTNLHSDSIAFVMYTKRKINSYKSQQKEKEKRKEGKSPLCNTSVAFFCVSYFQPNFS